MNTFPFPAVLDVDHFIQLHITVPCLALIAGAARCEPACGQWLELLSLFGAPLVTGWWKPPLGLFLGLCCTAVLLLTFQHRPPKVSHPFTSIWGLWYMIPMAQCLSDFSDFIPTLWMEIFHVVVLCFSWQAKALLHVARYIFQVLKSLSFNGFLRFSLCSRCVETKASAQRLAERCLTGKHSAISYLFLIWPHPKHCLLTDVGLGELHIDYRDHTKPMVQPEFDRMHVLGDTSLLEMWGCYLLRN